MGFFDWFKKKEVEEIPQLSPEEELEVQISRQAKQNVTAEESIMTLEEATKIALEVSSDFETQDGFCQVTGNFDDQLLSCGSLQWAWKQGTQQKLVLRLESLYPGLILKLMPLTGKRYLQYASMSVSNTESSISVWSHGERVYDPYFTELKRLWGSTEMISVQLYYAKGIALTASNYARDWAQASRNSPDYTLQEFCFFFDVAVNNGGMRGITYHDVIERVSSSNQQMVLEEVLHWCSTRTRAYAAWKDCVKNAEAWRIASQSASVNEINLLILGWLRSLRAIHTYQASVMNRRGILAFGIGYNEGVKKDLNQSYVNHWPSTIVN